MNKYVIAIIIFSISGAAHGWGLAPGMAQGISQGIEDNQQRQMSKAWANCINQGGGAACGQPPAPAYQQPAYQPPRQCSSYCMPDVYGNTSCNMQCR